MSLWIVAIAAVVNWFIGALWYAFIGRRWLKELGKTVDHRDIIPYVIAALGSFGNATGLALGLRMFNVHRLSTALALGAAVWLVFVLSTSAKHYFFSNWSARLLLLDTTVDLVGFLAMAAVLFYGMG